MSVLQNEGIFTATQIAPVKCSALLYSPGLRRLRCTFWNDSQGFGFHLPATVQVGPSVGFSLIMVRLVSRETRTVESKGIWKAVRRYCVRTIGRSCLVSICCWISPNSLLNFSISSGVFPCDQ